MKTLIIGDGEVGKALYEVVKGTHETFIRDIEPLFVPDVEVLLICYPDHEGFDKTTKNYIDIYKPKLTIINSSVSVGTTQQCGQSIIYSPVRGRHPKLASDLKIYTKFIFGSDVERLEDARVYFEDCGINTISSFDIRGGELVKLISNIHMGIEIAWRQEVQRILKVFHVEQFTYEEWERTYASGYIESGDHHLIRPKMKPDPIGGHCILPCTEILKKQFPSKILDFVLESNEKAKREIF